MGCKTWRSVVDVSLILNPFWGVLSVLHQRSKPIQLAVFLDAILTAAGARAAGSLSTLGQWQRVPCHLSWSWRTNARVMSGAAVSK